MWKKYVGDELYYKVFRVSIARRTDIIIVWTAGGNIRTIITLWCTMADVPLVNTLIARFTGLVVSTITHSTVTSFVFTLDYCGVVTHGCSVTSVGAWL